MVDVPFYYTWKLQLQNEAGSGVSGFLYDFTINCLSKLPLLSPADRSWATM
jgi:hypothetical protein